MDPFTDNFIDYDCQYEMKNEALFDPEFTMSPPFSEKSEFNGAFGGFFPKTIKNILDPEDEAPRKESFASDANQSNNNKRPFQVVKKKKNDSTESSDNGSVDESDGLYVPEERDTKINTRSKRIQKKEKGKDKVKTPKPDALETLIQKVDSKYLPEGYDDPNMDDKAKKRMIQMIRNRVSAQTSRDRKKAYLNQVEQVREAMTDENLKLVRENTKLIDELKKLREENEELKRSAGSLCSKCGCTLDYDGPSPNRDTTDSTASNPSSPSYERGQSGSGRRNFFGFGMAFAALACFLMVINGGSIGPFYQGQGKSSKSVKTNFMGRMMEQQQCQRTDRILQPENLFKNIDQELERAAMKFGEFPPLIMEKINFLMEQFSSNSNQIYKAYENSKVMVDLTNRILPTGADAKNASNGNSTFLRKQPTKEIKNRTSTLFCPSGFELLKHDDQIEIEQEINGKNQPRAIGKALNLETAEYIQLIIPKSSIGQYRVPEVTNGTMESPVLQNDLSEDDGAFYEVWVKPFAFRELGSAVPEILGELNFVGEGIF